ncbi:tetratricopeptide repeat protein [Alkalisalibacterium limincola]|uniref:protein O-GlcNAc transferase n=1 Tax=Alkalisalibacterium limincola TaxID=2699169 RepID=A0A5C8KYD4_9GAMM|nr:tetratricopeptide repeat protein [Alkalisalibacterium limincola]TXK65064.1 tetratricopeptide repeat protein [Alkalisalibacterium limincola]
MDPRERALGLHRDGQLVEADRAYRAALDAHPDDARLRHFHGGLLMQSGRLEEAALQFQKVAAQAPDAVENLAALALCLRDLGRLAEALPVAHRVLALRPDDALALLVAGSTHAALGEGTQAERLLRECVGLAPANTEAWHHLGVVLQEQGRWDEAASAHERVAARRAGAWYNVGLCRERQGDLLLARECYGRFNQAHPDRIAGWTRRAQVQALLCDFPGEAESVARIRARLARPEALAVDDQAEPFVLSFLPLPDADRRRLLEHAVHQVQAKAGRLADGMQPAKTGARQAGTHLRLGYVSPDFGEHAVGSLMRDVFAAHDRGRVHVTAYSLRRHAGATADAIRSGCDVFRDCEAMATPAIAESIAADGIDVLVDLGSYTSGARPELLALRPAPVQLAYLGFLHPHGAPWLDAVVLDPWLLPAGAEAMFGEPVRRLSTLMLPGRSAEPAPIDRARFGLPAERVLLAAFNNSYKFDRALLEAWLEIAGRAPQAVFVLSVPPQAEPLLRRHWAGQGG